MKKRVFAVGFAACVIVLLGMYSAHPKYMFTIYHSQFSRGSYVFSIYGSRTMVVTYGYKKPHEINSEMSADKLDLLDYRRKEKMYNEMLMKIGIKQLSEKQYNEFVRLFAAADKKETKYLRAYRVPDNLRERNDPWTASIWETVFPTKNGISNAYFARGDVIDGEPLYVEIAQKAADISPISVTDMVGNSVRLTDVNDPNFVPFTFFNLSNWKFSDRVVMRIWPSLLLKNTLKPEIHDFWDYLFWELFPPNEENCKYCL